MHRVVDVPGYGKALLTGRYDCVWPEGVRGTLHQNEVRLLQRLPPGESRLDMARAVLEAKEVFGGELIDVVLPRKRRRQGKHSNGFMI